jgi:glutamate/tyrosine decarboxylase-like PLP-dependent enzyme
VIDPIPELAALAAEIGASFHTDACMGGLVLPFMERLGHDIPPWDFRVPGVTTISADLHKLGYAPKGASVVIHRSKELRRYQTFVTDDWLGGLYGSPAMQGTRQGMPMACAWAVLHHLGEEGYLRLTETTIAATRRMIEGTRAIAGLRVLGEPEAQCLATAVEPGWDDRLDAFALGDALHARGWYLDRQKPPDSLHATVSAGNAPVIEDYLADLQASVDDVAGARAGDRSASYSTLE